MERRALYNIIRMNWLHNPAEIVVEDWQVEDYRSISLDQIFNKLEEKGFAFDRTSFLALAEEFDTPEDLVDDLLKETKEDQVLTDQIYLLIFELWRRLVPEKQSLSVFCDELDYEIEAYESLNRTDSQTLQDTLANLAILLDDNADEEENPQEIFKLVSHNSAHDLENFLYDYIIDQIENNDLSYAAELLDDFSPYMSDSKWFDLLRARITAVTDMPKADLLIQKLVRTAMEGNDLEFILEVLSILTPGGYREQFEALVAQALMLVKTEEQFQDLLKLSAEYFHYLDHEIKEVAIKKILRQRSQTPLEQLLDQNDPHFHALTRVVLS